MSENRDNESGNALWFILLAVALMAVLTMAVSRMSDTTEQNADIERYHIQASGIMRYTAGIKQTVDTMRLRDVSESTMSFENSVTATDYSNANCSGGDCLVFGSAGGGAYYKTPDTGWLDSAHSGDARYGEWEFTGTNSVLGMSSARPELIMSISYLNAGLCAEINALLNISGVPADADGFDTTAYQGSFAGASAFDNMDDHESGCFQDTGVGRDYTFYQVLIKR